MPILSLFFNGTVVNEQKHLGLILDSKLSFARHVNEKIIKAIKGMGIIKYLSKFLPLKTLDQMYKALVRSHLNYRDIIYHTPTLNSQNNLGVTLNSLMQKVDKELNTKLLLQLLVHDKVLTVQNYTKN